MATGDWLHSYLFWSAFLVRTCEGMGRIANQDFIDIR